MTKEPSAAGRRVRSPAKRELAQVFTFPTLFLLAVVLFGLGAAIWNESQRSSAERHMREDVAKADATLAVERQRLKAQFESHELTVQQRDEQMAEASARNDRDVRDFRRTWVRAMAIPWYFDLVVIALTGGVPLLLAMLFVRAVLGILARRLGASLRSKGYEWIDHAEAVLLLWKLGAAVRHIPPAVDFQTIPGAQETVESLVAFVKWQQKRRRR